MNPIVDQNINKDMSDSDLIDVESMDFSDTQTWLYKVPDDSGQKLDIVDWILSYDWPVYEDSEYLKQKKEQDELLDNILKNEVLSMPDKHKFDSRTYVKPKKRSQRPSIHIAKYNIEEVVSNSPSLSTVNQSANKYLTYNKYNNPLGPISPMLRLKTFNVDTNSENSTVVKEYAMKRKSLVQDDDPQLEDIDITLMPSASDSSSMEHTPSKPINIDLSQPAHNLHNTFNRGFSSILNERGTLNMYQSGESLMRMSPPSLVSSLLMESSGTFNSPAESLDIRKSIPHKEPAPPSGRESIDPMMTSMSLSILDEKDMNTSFLSQTTFPDNDSLMNSLPPSLVSSVNSSYVISNTNTSKPKETDANIFSSTTFTHLEQSERLLSARPRCALYNSFTKRESPSIRNSESYTKSREEACQIDTAKILNENSDKKDSPKLVAKPSPEMCETITLHYSNNKFRRDNDAEKENFKTDDAFYKDMGVVKPDDSARNSLNVTMGKQELNEIIQARQKLSLARKGLPSQPDKSLPNPADTSAIKTIQLPNQTITVPRQSMENASELLLRRRVMNTNGFDRQEEPTRDTPKRNATFKKVPSKPSAMDAAVVYMKTDDNNIIDINSATLNLIDASEKTPPDTREWGSQERAMVGSSESTDTGTFSSSSPPDSVPDSVPHGAHIASTPLLALKKGSMNDLINLHNTISPIYDMVDDKSYTVTKVPNATPMATERNFEPPKTTTIDSWTVVKKSSVKRDIMAPKVTPEKKIMTPEKKIMAPSVVQKMLPSRVPAAHGHMAPPMAVPKKTGLPTSKLRQYSSHRELSRIPAQPASGIAVASRGLAFGGRTMVRRGVYASNPVLSPTASVAPPHALATEPEPEPAPSPPAPAVLVSGSYTIANVQKADDKNPKPKVPAPPPLVRQGTETLRRQRSISQLVAPRDPVVPVASSRPYSIAGAPQHRSTVARPSSGNAAHKPAPPPHVTPAAAPVVEQPRASALPRPSRLPAPRRTLRPPSVYSVAPTADVDHY